MSLITPAVSAWLEKLLASAGKQGIALDPGTPLPDLAVAAEEEGALESPLAGQIRAAIAAGGVNIALYMIGDPDKNNDKEFKRQATVWAGNHGAFGLAGSTVKKNLAMALSADPGKLVGGLLTAMRKELGGGTEIPVANLALFTHGGSRSMQVDSTGEGGGEKWAKAGSKVVQDLVAAVKPALTSGAKLHLFACNVAMNKDEAKGADDATRTDSFAEDLAELTGAEVWGHENAAHTTGNSRLVQVADTNSDGNAERLQVRDVLARRFLLHVDPSLTPDQMGWLDGKLKVSAWIKGSLRLKGKGTKKVDRHQVFIEEVSMMGFDRLFDLLIPDAPPGEAVFRGLFPEHDQIDKLVAGAADVHAAFHLKLDAMAGAIRAARAAPDFPPGEPG